MLQRLNKPQTWILVVTLTAIMNLCLWFVPSIEQTLAYFHQASFQTHSTNIRLWLICCDRKSCKSINYQSSGLCTLLSFFFFLHFYSVVTSKNYFWSMKQSSFRWPEWNIMISLVSVFCPGPFLLDID